MKQGVLLLVVSASVAYCVDGNIHTTCHAMRNVDQEPDPNRWGYMRNYCKFSSLVFDWQGMGLVARSSSTSLLHVFGGPASAAAKADGRRGCVRGTCCDLAKGVREWGSDPDRRERWNGRRFDGVRPSSACMTTHALRRGVIRIHLRVHQNVCTLPFRLRPTFGRLLFRWL